MKSRRFVFIAFYSKSTKDTKTPHFLVILLYIKIQKELRKFTERSSCSKLPKHYSFFIFSINNSTQCYNMQANQSKPLHAHISPSESLFFLSRCTLFKTKPSVIYDVSSICFVLSNSSSKN